MPQVWLRFYGELNDFLPLAARHRTTGHRLETAGSVKDLIEALGVPHTEVELVLVDGAAVDFGYLVRGGERISVYPPFRRLPLGDLARLRPPLVGTVRFVADIHLGRLAGWLRLAGFDTLYRNDLDDEDAAALSAREGRVLLTRDQGLLKRSAVVYGYWVRAASPRQQFEEVLARFDLAGRAIPFSRCLRCNDVLERVAKSEVALRLPPRTREEFHEFARCPGCGRIYWRGSHYSRMARWLAEVLAAAPASPRRDP